MSGRRANVNIHCNVCTTNLQCMSTCRPCIRDGELTGSPSLTDLKSTLFWDLPHCTHYPVTCMIDWTPVSTRRSTRHRCRTHCIDLGPNRHDDLCRRLDHLFRTGLLTILTLFVTLLPRLGLEVFIASYRLYYVFIKFAKGRRFLTADAGTSHAALLDIAGSGNVCITT